MGEKSYEFCINNSNSVWVVVVGVTLVMFRGWFCGSFVNNNKLFDNTDETVFIICKSGRSRVGGGRGENEKFKQIVSSRLS